MAIDHISHIANRVYVSRVRNQVGVPMAGVSSSHDAYECFSMMEDISGYSHSIDLHMEVFVAFQNHGSTGKEQKIREGKDRQNQGCRYHPFHTEKMTPSGLGMFHEFSSSMFSTRW